MILRGIKKAISRIIILIVRGYQLIISPWLGPSCRHTPTCSSYMIEAVHEWGPFKGFWLGLKRIGRCHPWGTSGYDPVPRSGSEQSGSESVTNAGKLNDL
ncbi:MAG: membrane protein insertion efficiency factor YidD [Balneolaceae bacterium]|nr:membrane protein insertion efficiency factor YidD [Balneolaceae bacterium]